MSLRDQLLKAGVVSKKDVRRVEQDLRADHKQAQANKRRASELAAEEAARAAAEKQAEVARRLEERKRREAAHEARERIGRIRQIIDHNALRGRGKLRYHFAKPDGRIGRIEVSDPIAWRLRCGEVGIALRPALGTEEPQIVVVSAEAARRLDAIDPTVVLHLVRDASGLAAADQQFLVPAWEISLLPHRR